MYLSSLDWSIVFIVAIVFIVIAWKTKKYAKSTADFLVANRVASRYVLTIAEGMVGLSAIGYIGAWQVTYNVGFGKEWWSQLSLPLILLLPLFGWVIYRFRETRALTMAQFFGMRYGKNFRIFAGIMCFTSGVLNYGIFPAVAAHFLYIIVDCRQVLFFWVLNIQHIAF